MFSPARLAQAAFHKDALFEPLARHAGPGVLLRCLDARLREAEEIEPPAPKPPWPSVQYGSIPRGTFLGRLFEPAFFLPARDRAVLLSGASSSPDSGGSDAAPVHRPGGSGQHRLLAVAAARRIAGRA